MYSEIQSMLKNKDPLRSCKNITTYVQDVYSKKENDYELTNGFAELMDVIFTQNGK
jgi:hypothetical protein